MSRHPNQMVDSANVRHIALALPGTEERLSWGMPTFRLAKGIFVALSDDEESMGFRFPKDERTEMLSAEPGKFFIRPGHDDNYNWLRVRLDAIDDEELQAIIVDSWRQLATKKLIAEYDATA